MTLTLLGWSMFFGGLFWVIAIIWRTAQLGERHYHEKKNAEAKAKANADAASNVVNLDYYIGLRDKANDNTRD